MRSVNVFLMDIVVGKACGPQGWCCQRRSIWCCKCESPRKANFRPSAIIDVRSCTPWTTSFLAKGTQDTRSTSSDDALGGAILLGTLAKSAVSPLPIVKVPLLRSRRLFMYKLYESGLFRIRPTVRLGKTKFETCQSPRTVLKLCKADGLYERGTHTKFQLPTCKWARETLG